MKKYLLVLMLAFMSLSLLMSPAEAKRLGGGGSFGKQSSNYARQAPSSPSYSQPSAAPARPAAAPAPSSAPQGVPARPASPWRNIVGGALVGLGLGALMSHFGMGGAGGGFGSLLTLILLVGAAFFLFRMFARARQQQSNNPVYAPPMPGVSPIGSAASATPDIGSGLRDINPPPAALSGNGYGSNGYGSNGYGSSSAAAVTPAMIEKWGIPADFDSAGFVHNAKTYFIRLQAAWDRADINDIREFTTPEMFAELRVQIQERGAAANATDVVQLDAELLGIETQAYGYLATVRFQGLIKEAPELSAEPFAEIWNLSKPQQGGGWVLAGIQQV